MLFFNLLWVWPANQHELHQKIPLSLDFHMGPASRKQWLKIKGRKVKSRYLFSFLPARSHWSVAPLYKRPQLLSIYLSITATLLALSFCPGNRSIGSIGSLLLLAPPLILNHPLLTSLTSPHTSIISLFSKLFNYPNWVYYIYILLGPRMILWNTGTSCLTLPVPDHFHWGQRGVGVTFSYLCLCCHIQKGFA